jgi:hypothetical protein
MTSSEKSATFRDHALEALGLQKRDEEIDAERDGDGEAKERLEHATFP